LFNQILQLATGMTTVHSNANLSLIQPLAFVIHSCYFCCTRNCMADCTGCYATYSIW